MVKRALLAKSPIPLVLSAYILFASCTPGHPQEPRESYAPSPNFLAISGSAFTYRGKTVYLRGMNLSNGGATYDDEDYDEKQAFARGRTFRSRLTEDERDYARLESWGVNVVRLGLDWHWFTADKEQFFVFLDQHVAWAKSHHIWLIPVMFVPPGGFQDYTHHTRFWRNTAYRNSLKAFWVEVATRYAQESTIAGYDLLNEPSSAQVKVDWWPYAGELRDAIWAVDKNHFVVIESHEDGQFWERLPLRSRVKYPNVVYSIHHYAPESMTHNGVFQEPAPLTYPGQAPDGNGKVKMWNKATMDQLMRREGRIPVTWAQEAKVPLLIGEWGSVKRTEGYLRWITDQIELMQDWGVNWTHFAYREYDPRTDFGVFNARDGMSSNAPADTGLVEAFKTAMASNIRPT